MPYAIGPFRSLESLSDAAVSVLKEALRGNRDALNDGVYLLWNGSKFVGDPILPETYVDLPVHESTFWSSEAEVILKHVHDLGLSGFAYAFRIQNRNCWYVLCFNSTKRVIFTAAKLYFDRREEEFKVKSLNDRDWSFLRTYYLVDGTPALYRGEVQDHA